MAQAGLRGRRINRPHLANDQPVEEAAHGELLFDAGHHYLTLLKLDPVRHVQPRQRLNCYVTGTTIAFRTNSKRWSLLQNPSGKPIYEWGFRTLE
jgi:hypothetical protein